MSKEIKKQIDAKPKVKPKSKEDILKNIKKQEEFKQPFKQAPEKKIMGIGGRKSKWFTNILPNLDRVSKMLRQGKTETQVAKFFNVHPSTWEEYKKKYPELKEEIKKDRMALIEDLEKSLFQKALGGYPLKRKKIYRNYVGGKTITREEEWIDEAAPDTGALIFALKNLQGRFWKNADRVEVVKEEVKKDALTSRTLDALKNRSIDLEEGKK